MIQELKHYRGLFCESYLLRELGLQACLYLEYRGKEAKMTQEERRIWLIQELQKEMPEYAHYPIPETSEEQWRLLRGLFNVRSPKETSEDFLKIQDAFLQEMTREKGIVDGDSLEATALDKRLVLWQGDISTLKVDAIVNACNSALLGCFIPNHNCIDNVEHSMAGVEMRYACFRQMQEQGHEEAIGQCKITPGYNLPAKYVLHTVGPMVQGKLTEKEIKELKSCYRACLTKATESKCKSVAFCCISTGVFMFPKDKAAEIAVSTVREWLDTHPESTVERVIFNVFTEEDKGIYEELLKG